MSMYTAFTTLITVPSVPYSSATSGVAASTDVLDTGDRNEQNDSSATMMALRWSGNRSYTESGISTTEGTGAIGCCSGVVLVAFSGPESADRLRPRLGPPLGSGSPPVSASACRTGTSPASSASPTGRFWHPPGSEPDASRACCLRSRAGLGGPVVLFSRKFSSAEAEPAVRFCSPGWSGLSPSSFEEGPAVEEELMACGAHSGLGENVWRDDGERW